MGFSFFRAGEKAYVGEREVFQRKLSLDRVVTLQIIYPQKAAFLVKNM